MAIISKLATIRKEKGLSQEQLSALSGVSRVTISRIESGNGSPTWRTLKRIAKVLNVPVSDFFDLIEKAG